MKCDSFRFRIFIFFAFAGLLTTSSINPAFAGEFSCKSTYYGFDGKGDEADQYAIPLRLLFEKAKPDGTYPTGDGTLITFFCSDAWTGTECGVENYFLKSRDASNKSYWPIRNTLMKKTATSDWGSKSDVNITANNGAAAVTLINSWLTVEGAKWVTPCEYTFQRNKADSKKKYLQIIEQRYIDYLDSPVGSTSGGADSAISEYRNAKEKELAELEKLMPKNKEACEGKNAAVKSDLGEIWGSDIFNAGTDRSANVASKVLGIGGGIGTILDVLTLSPATIAIGTLVYGEYTGYPDHATGDALIGKNYGDENSKATDKASASEAEEAAFDYDYKSRWYRLDGDVDDEDIVGMLSNMGEIYKNCETQLASEPKTVFGVTGSSTINEFGKLNVKQAEYASKDGKTDNKGKLIAEAPKDEANYAETKSSAATGASSTPGGSGKSGPSGPQAKSAQKPGGRLPGSTDASSTPGSGSGLGGLGSASTGPLAQPSEAASSAGGGTGAGSSGTYAAGRGGHGGSGGYARGDNSFSVGEGAPAADAEVSFNAESTGAEARAMGSEDPEDYFTRIGLDENLFKRIHDKYHKQAVAWETGKSDENRKPAAAASPVAAPATPITVPPAVTSPH